MSWREDFTEIGISGSSESRSQSAIRITAPRSHSRDLVRPYPGKPYFDTNAECKRTDHRLYRAIGIKCPCYEQSYIIITDAHEPISHNQYCTETHWKPKQSEIHVHPDDILFIEPGEKPLSVKGLFREMQQLRKTVLELQERLETLTARTNSDK